MVQLRYWDYTSPVPSRDDNFINRALNDYGPYRGLDLSVNGSGLLIATTGAGLQPDGVVWEETDDVVISFIPPGAATNYTVVALHDDQQRIGGVPVEYEYQSGLFTTITDGVVLGWIYHPGGGAPIATSMLQSAPKLLPSVRALELVDLNRIELIPEYPRSYVDLSTIDPNITFEPKLFATATEFLIYQKVSNSPAAPGPLSLTQHFQFYVDEAPRPVSFSFYCDVPNVPSTDLTVQIYDTDKVLLPVTGSPINTSGWETKTVVVDRTGGTFNSNKPYTMRLVFNLEKGQEISIGRIKAVFWPYPA